MDINNKIKIIESLTEKNKQNFIPNLNILSLQLIPKNKEGFLKYNNIED